jgi:hypothetical protein
VEHGGAGVEERKTRERGMLCWEKRRALHDCCLLRPKWADVNGITQAWPTKQISPFYEQVKKYKLHFNDFQILFELGDFIA